MKLYSSFLALFFVLFCVQDAYAVKPKSALQQSSQAEKQSTEGSVSEEIAVQKKPKKRKRQKMSDEERSQARKEAWARKKQSMTPEQEAAWKKKCKEASLEGKKVYQQNKCKKSLEEQEKDRQKRSAAGRASAASRKRKLLAMPPLEREKKKEALRVQRKARLDAMKAAMSPEDLAKRHEKIVAAAQKGGEAFKRKQAELSQKDKEKKSKEHSKAIFAAKAKRQANMTKDQVKALKEQRSANMKSALEKFHEKMSEDQLKKYHESQQLARKNGWAIWAKMRTSNPSKDQEWREKISRTRIARFKEMPKDVFEKWMENRRKMALDRLAHATPEKLEERKKRHYKNTQKAAVAWMNKWRKMTDKEKQEWRERISHARIAQLKEMPKNVLEKQNEKFVKEIQPLGIAAWVQKRKKMTPEAKQAWKKKISDSLRFGRLKRESTAPELLHWITKELKQPISGELENEKGALSQAEIHARQLMKMSPHEGPSEDEQYKKAGKERRRVHKVQKTRPFQRFCKRKKIECNFPSALFQLASILKLEGKDHVLFKPALGLSIDKALRIFIFNEKIAEDRKLLQKSAIIQTGRLLEDFNHYDIPGLNLEDSFKQARDALQATKAESPVSLDLEAVTMEKPYSTLLHPVCEPVSDEEWRGLKHKFVQAWERANGEELGEDDISALSEEFGCRLEKIEALPSPTYWKSFLCKVVSKIPSLENITITAEIMDVLFETLGSEDPDKILTQLKAGEDDFSSILRPTSKVKILLQVATVIREMFQEYIDARSQKASSSVNSQKAARSVIINRLNLPLSLMEPYKEIDSDALPEGFLKNPKFFAAQFVQDLFAPDQPSTKWVWQNNHAVFTEREVAHPLPITLTSVRTRLSKAIAEGTITKEAINQFVRGNARLAQDRALVLEGKSGRFYKKNPQDSSVGGAFHCNLLADLILDEGMELIHWDPKQQKEKHYAPRWGRKSSQKDDSITNKVQLKI